MKESFKTLAKTCAVSFGAGAGMYLTVLGGLFATFVFDTKLKKAVAIGCTGAALASQIIEHTSYVNTKTMEMIAQDEEEMRQVKIYENE